MALKASHLCALYSPDEGVHEFNYRDAGSFFLLPFGGHRDLLETLLEGWTHPTATLWYCRSELAFLVTDTDHFTLYRFRDRSSFQEELEGHLSL
jgi:hypothetical protein